MFQDKATKVLSPIGYSGTVLIILTLNSVTYCSARSMKAG